MTSKSFQNNEKHDIPLVAVGMAVMTLCSGCAGLNNLPGMAELARTVNLSRVRPNSTVPENAFDSDATEEAIRQKSESARTGSGEKDQAIVEKNPTHFVSVKNAVLRSEPTELSDAVAGLDYNTGVRAVEDVAVQLPFDGDPDLFPSNLVPHWAKVSVGDKSGYLPLLSLADAGLMKMQNPEDPIPSASGDKNEKFVNAALSARRPVDDKALGVFLRDGNLSGSMPRPVARQLPNAGNGVGASIVSGLRGAWASTKSAASKLVGKEGGSDGNADVVFDQIGPLQEFQFGRAIAARVAALHPMLPPDDPRSAYVAQVGAAVASASNDPAPYHGYVFAVMKSSEINAFAVPGGFVFVTTGLLDFIKTEDELAVLLAREIAHVELRQIRKAVGDEKLLPFFTELKKDPSSATLAETLNEAFGLVHDGCGVENEGVADWRAAQLAARVGYDPRALGDVLKRFASSDDEIPYSGAEQAEARASDVNDYLEAFGFSDVVFQGADVRASRYERSVHAK